MQIARRSAILLIAGLVVAAPVGPVKADTLMQTAQLLGNLSTMNLQTIGTRRGSPAGSVESLFGHQPRKQKRTLVAVGGSVRSGWGTTAFGTTAFGRTSFGRSAFGRTGFGQTAFGIH